MFACWSLTLLQMSVGLLPFWARDSEHGQSHFVSLGWKLMMSFCQNHLLLSRWALNIGLMSLSSQVGSSESGCICFCLKSWILRDWLYLLCLTGRTRDWSVVRMLLSHCLTDQRLRTCRSINVPSLTGQGFRTWLYLLMSLPQTQNKELRDSVKGYRPFYPGSCPHSDAVERPWPGYAKKNKSLSLEVFSSDLRSLRALRSMCWISAKFSASLLSVPLDFLLLLWLLCPSSCSFLGSCQWLLCPL